MDQQRIRMVMGACETMKTSVYVNTMTFDQIRVTGMSLLSQHLGPIGMVRFLQQSETRWGDYTKERHEWLGQDDIRTLAAKIMAQRPSKVSE